jgi:acetyl esterase
LKPDIAQLIPEEKDPNISKDTRAFLKVLNSGDGAPLGKLSPKDARQVLKCTKISMLRLQ